MNVVVFTGFCGCGGVEAASFFFAGGSLLQAFVQSAACETQESKPCHRLQHVIGIQNIDTGGNRA